MDQTVKTFTSDGADARKWIGRIIMAVNSNANNAFSSVTSTIQ